MRKSFFFAIATTLIVSTLTVPEFALAQKDGAKKSKDKSLGIFETRREYDEFMGGLKSLRDPEVDAMLPALNDMVLGRPIGKTAQQYETGGSPVMTLLADKRVRQELDVVDDQVDQIKRLNSQLQERLAKEVRSLDLTDPTQVVATFREITESAKAEMEDVFLPHQLDRLKQLGVRSQMNRQGVLGALLNEPLAAELEITDQQMDQLRQSAKEIESELAREMEELKAKARQKLFANLTREQQRKLDQLIGDEYQFTDKPVGIAGGPKGKPNAKKKVDKRKPEKKSR